MPLLGKHTLNETRDLLAVVDYRFTETGKAYEALHMPPPALAAQWTVLRTRWAVDRKTIAAALVQEAIQKFPLPSDYVATEPEYVLLLSYVQGQEWIPGSLQDITHQIEALSGKQVLYPNQPKQGSKDVDIELFGKLDATTRQIDAGAAATKDAAARAAKSNTAVIVGGTAVATLLGYAFLKSRL